MQFLSISFPGIIPPTLFPSNISLALPDDSSLPLDQQHYLLYIPWDDLFLSEVPEQYQAFFTAVLPNLHVRTTEVHTAVCLGYLKKLLAHFDEPINERVVALGLILHDSGWSKLSEEEIAMSLGVSGLQLTPEAIGPKEKHAVEGAKIARKILENYVFKLPLSKTEKELIINAVLYHDKPELVAEKDAEIPIEIKLVVDLDHIWSFTYHNFWQDTLRKKVAPAQYLENLEKDLDGYFVTDPGKELAQLLLNKRREEVTLLQGLE